MVLSKISCITFWVNYSSPHSNYQQIYVQYFVIVSFMKLLISGNCSLLSSLTISIDTSSDGRHTIEEKKSLIYLTLFTDEIIDKNDWTRKLHCSLSSLSIVHLIFFFIYFFVHCILSIQSSFFQNSPFTFAFLILTVFFFLFFFNVYRK